MDKDATVRMILVMVLGIMIIMVYQHFWGPREQPRPEPPEPAETTAPADEKPGEPEQADEAEAEKPETPGREFTVTTAPPEDVSSYRGPVLGRAVHLGPYAMAMEVTARGAGIRRLVLNDYFATVGDRDKPTERREKFELVRPEKGAPAFVVTALEVITPDNQVRTVDLRVPDGEGGRTDPWWTLEGPPTADEATFRLDVQRNGEPFLTLYKTYRLRPRESGDGRVPWDRRYETPEAYAPEMELRLEDHTGELVSAAVVLRGPEGLVKEETRGDQRMVCVGFASDERDAEFKTAKDAADPDKPEKARFSGEADWAGAVDKYFGLVAAADVDDPRTRFESARVYRAGKEGGNRLPGIRMTTFQLPFDEDDHRAEGRFTLFAGPKDPDLLEYPIFRRRGLLHLVQWSRTCCCAIPGVKHISKFMVGAIDVISGLVVNKGLAIIILVILVQIVLLPINRFSQLSMLKMQEVQPELKKLKEQYKDDPQGLQKAQLQMMRERGANPMLGCLPMLLQMPIWIALYSGISVAISLRHAPFVLWIEDLSRPDALFAIPETTIPILQWLGEHAGWQFNLLPLLLCASMYASMKAQPQTGGASPEAERQQKMMKYMMPAFMLFVFYTAPSALNLYIMTSSIIRLFEQKYIRWHHAQLKARPPKPQKPKRKGFISRWLDNYLEEAQRLQRKAKKSDNPFEKRKKDK